MNMSRQVQPVSLHMLIYPTTIPYHVYKMLVFPPLSPFLFFLFPFDIYTPTVELLLAFIYDLVNDTLGSRSHSDSHNPI